MSSTIKFIFAAIVIMIVLFLLILFPVHMVAFLFLAIVCVGIYDLVQTKHTILRNFPVIGHFRYLFELIAPEIHQYFVENNTDGKPIDRNMRSYIYQRAKLENDMHPFGTELDLQLPHASWLRHSIYPAKRMAEAPRVVIGGKHCKQPYAASLLNVSAMSFGALGSHAVTALNLAAKGGGFYHNTGEGGISEYHLQGGDLVYQLGTGYFGSRDEEGNFSPENFKKTIAHPAVKMIEIKISQGAKPGHGGILPAAKNNEQIAAIRGVKPHTEVVSPPGHTAFSSAQGLVEFIQQLRDLSDGKPIGFKLCIGHQQEFIDICEAMVATGITPDFITVDGSEGGTGAAPIIFSDNVGMPWENGLVFVVDTLRKYGLKEEIRVITACKIITGFDIYKALCLGADVCNAARGMMIALGCIQALECHKNTCPTGVATNNPRLMRGLVVEEKWVRVKNYQEQTLDDFLDLLAASGISRLEDLNRSMIYKQLNFKSVGYEALYPTSGESLTKA